MRVFSLSLFVYVCFWATAIAASSDEGSSIAADPSTLRHYYQTNNLVGLFDALVLRDGREQRVLRPEVVIFDETTFKDLKYSWGGSEALDVSGVEATISMPPNGQPFSKAYFDGVRPEGIGIWPAKHLAALSSFFGSTPEHLNLFEWQIESGLRAYQRNVQNHSANNWSTCNHLELDLNDGGDLVPREEATTIAIAAVYLTNISLVENSSRCVLETVLFGIGLRGILHPGRSNIFELRELRTVAGPIALCALKALRDDRIKHLMNRDAALIAVSRMQEDGVTCD